MYAWGGRKTENGYEFPPFYDGFINELKKNGNDVLVYANADKFGYQYEESLPQKVLEELKVFNPDLFIFFSNQFWDVSPYFDCPVLVYGVDAPLIYSNKKALRNNHHRYRYLISQKSDIQEICTGLGAHSSQIEYMPFVSAIKNRTADKDKNIVFCGSVWLWDGCQEVVKYMSSSPTEKDALFNKEFHKELMNNPSVDQADLFNKLIEKLGFVPRCRLNVTNREVYAGRWSGVNRMKHLQAVADLGLEIYGNHWAQNSMAYFPDLALCWNSKSITGIKQWEDLLNRSRIGFNISHLQAKEGFSWRVVDTMASGACLVTNWTPDLDRLFGKGKIPSYQTQYEAREVCQKLLANDNMREDIIAFCNKKIDEGFRPIHALKIIEDFTHVSLVRTGETRHDYRIQMLVLDKSNRLVLKTSMLDV